MNARDRRTAALTLGGITLAVTLGGCASGTDATADGAGAAPNEEYTDGDYQATGEYQSPGGGESIEVEISLEGDIITAVNVTPNATEENAILYQGQFAGGIAEEVVGVDIDELSVDRVAGSSLTSDGFNDAIEQIKADAVA